MGVLARMRDVARRLWPLASPAGRTDATLGGLAARREEATTRFARAREALLGGPGVVIDPDDHEFQRLSSGQRFRTRDLTPIQQDRMLEIAWYLVEANPFAARLVGLMTDLVVGEGLTVSGKDPALNDIVKRTWHHPINQLDRRVRELYQALSLNGELILPVARNPITGIPHIGYIDPMQVARVRTRPDNVLVPDVIELKGDGGAPGATLKVVQEDPVSGLLTGDVFYFRINAPPNATRGRSDLLRLADWLDLYDQLMFAEVERVKLLSSFVWEVTMEGADESQIRKRLSQLGTPAAGTVFGHNEKEELRAITPDLKAQDRSEVARMLAIHIGGSFGYPLSWLGFVDSNRATIEGQADVMLKTPAARQKEFAAQVALILRYAIEGAVTANRALYRDVTTRDVEVHVPEIYAKDIARVGSVVASIVQALDIAQQNGTMSRRAAVVVQLAVLKHLGVDLDIEEVLGQAEEERAERDERADARMALVARARAAQQATAGTQEPELEPEEARA